MRLEVAALEAIVQRFLDAMDPSKIWLFGSGAGGEHKPDSNSDLLVVMRNADGDEAGNDFDRV